MLKNADYQLLQKVKTRGLESRRFRETMAVTADMGAPAQGGKDGLEGPIVKVVLITEGLGNSRDKNFYGPEAIRSAAQVFEGAQMRVDHPSYSEEKDIPEGRVKTVVGYYKGLRVESIDGLAACVGEVHFDRSDEGWNAYQKAKTAIHYAHEFPGSDKDYVGLSVNAMGESEPRRMNVEGKEMQVNYVLRFTEAVSCDMVTFPARGGKFVALMESIAGARIQKEESRMETLKRLEAAQAALKEAEGEKDADARQRKIAEARKEVDSLLKDIREAAAAEAKKKEGMKHDPDDDGCECEACMGKRESEAEAKKKEQEESEAEAKKKKAEADRKAPEAVRAHKLAVRSLVKESGLGEEFFDLADLEGMTLTEAEREIARTKRVHEASAKELLRRYDVSAGMVVRESGSGGGAAKTNNDAFPKISA